MKLGKTGIDISRIGLGTWSIGGGSAWGGDHDLQVVVDVRVSCEERCLAALENLQHFIRLACEGEILSLEGDERAVLADVDVGFSRDVAQETFQPLQLGVVVAFFVLFLSVVDDIVKHYDIVTADSEGIVLRSEVAPVVG